MAKKFLEQVAISLHCECIFSLLSSSFIYTSSVHIFCTPDSNISLQEKFKFTLQSLIRAFQSSQQLSSTSPSQIKVGKSPGDVLAYREGGRGAAAKKRKGKRGGRNEAPDADTAAKGSSPSDAPAAGADGDGQQPEEGRGEGGQPARPRRAGNGRRTGAGARRERRGKPDEGSAAGSQADAAGQAEAVMSAAASTPSE
jgi:hypothetical protein